MGNDKAVSGALFEDHREKRIPSIALGTIYNSERRLPTTNDVRRRRNIVVRLYNDSVILLKVFILACIDVRIGGEQ